MKKSALLILSSIFLMALSSCETNNKKQNDNSSTESTNTMSTRKILKREVPVTMDFYQITNLSAATVVFSNGPFKVYEEGDSALLNNLSYEFDGGVLTIKTPMEANNDMASYAGNDSLVVHVSCPELKTVALCATGGFVCHDTITTENFQMGGLVMGNIDIDKVVAEKFRYESNGSTKLNLGMVECGECVVISTGDGILNLNVNAKTNAYLDIKNESQMNINVNSPLVEGLIETKREVSMTMQTNDLQLNVLAGTVNLAGKAAKQNVRKGQLAIINNAMQ